MNTEKCFSSHSLKPARKSGTRTIATAIGLATLFFVLAVQPATATTRCVNPGGSGGCYPTISAAVAAASAGDTITVANGRYAEQVVITQSLSLLASAHVEIDATGKANGIFVNGMSAAPSAGVTGVYISGFTVANANFEGILVANASDVSLVNNQVLYNDLALNINSASCPGLPTTYETNEQEDCGEGIHLIAVDHSIVANNVVSHNSGGILITDETGPTSNNLITGNTVRNNPYDCGITIASHGRASTVSPGLSFGITNLTISGNDSSYNGNLLPGAGAGVGIFAPFPGTTAADIVVINNDLHNNGLPGVTMHNHAGGGPPVNMNNNLIVGNRISGNGVDTDDAATPGTTGINIFSVTPVTGTVIAQNVISDEQLDIAFNAPSGQINAHLNSFGGREIGVDNLGSGSIDATENWWGCPAGPTGSGYSCSTVAGVGIVYTPWLTSPFGGGAPSSDGFGRGGH